MVILTRLAPLALGVLLATGSLPDLFRKSKEQFQLGAYADALKTLELLDTESQKPENEGQRAAVLPPLLFYRGASQAALGRSEEARDTFEQFLAYQPNTTLDPARYPRSVLTAFENARKSVGTRRGRVDEAGLVAAYAGFRPPATAEAESPAEDWAEGPVRYVLTSEESGEFGRLSDPIARSEFVANFWRSRDPKPETPVNEYRVEFAKRVAFADSRFPQDELRGSLTDRGMVFVLLGPPSYSGRKPLRTGDDAADASGLSRYTHSEISVAERAVGSNSERLARIDKVNGPGTTMQDAASNWIEVWHYLRRDLPREIPNPELVFEFVTKAGYGKNVLQRESSALQALERAKKVARRGETPPRS